MRSRTALSAGSWNGVNVPLRARTSHAIASATTEKLRAKPQPNGKPNAGAFWGCHSVARRCRTELELVAPCKRPLGYIEIKAIGGEPEKGYREHNRIHRIVGAVGAQGPDQVAETFLSNDQLR